jgi:hypothetical protein
MNKCIVQSSAISNPQCAPHLFETSFSAWAAAARVDGVQHGTDACSDHVSCNVVEMRRVARRTFVSMERMAVLAASSATSWRQS